MPDQNLIHTLNHFLQGQYMGIHGYEHHIQKLRDPAIKKHFQSIQQDHKLHAMKVAERIQNLGGTPVDDEGIVGSVQGFVNQMMLPESNEKLIDSALKGEAYGIQTSEEIVKGDLDSESRQLIEDILVKDREHVDLLKRLVH